MVPMRLVYSAVASSLAITIKSQERRPVLALLAPGSTMLVTDAPILGENSASGFTVLSDGPPEEIAQNR